MVNNKIIEINDNGLLLEETNYNILSESYKKLEQKMKTLQIKYNNLLVWKKNHNCNNINLKKTDKYREIILLLYKNIKYTPLYLELKKENESLQLNYNNIQKNDVLEKQKNDNSLNFYNINEKVKNMDKEIPFPNFPIININKDEDLHNIDWKIHVSTEIYNIIKNNYNLYEKIYQDKNVNQKTLNEAIIYIINKRDIKNTRQNRHNIRNTLLRSFYLYNTYKDNLKYISFSFSKMTKISNKNWIVFLEYLNDKLNNIKKVKNKIVI